MIRVLVLYGSTHGQTAKVAHALAAALCAEGCLACAVNAADALRRVKARDYAGVIVAASLRAGSYQRSVRRWIRANATDLERLPTAFVSVCLGVLEHQPAVDRELERLARRFVTPLGWTPGRIEQVAGALKYTRYSWLMKRIMRHMAARAGGGTDLTRDYEYTDWNAVGAFARSFMQEHELGPRPPARRLAAAVATDNGYARSKP